MPSAHLSLREEDVVRLALEFLHNRELHISQLSLERETGVINGVYSDDLLFLRQVNTTTLCLQATILLSSTDCAVNSSTD